MIPYPIGTKFATDVPTGKGTLRTTFEVNYPSHFRDMSSQSFILISFFSSFRTPCKIRHKIPMRASIGLKFGTLEGLITADLNTKFGRNLMNIHGVMTNYLHKIRSNFCHAHKVNPWRNELKIAIMIE